jgi:hypothetical protein
MKNNFFCILTVMEDIGTDPHPHPDPFEDPDRHPDPHQNITIRNTAVCEVCGIVAVSF